MAKMLFGCECSGFPSEKFASLGHDVTSCDLKPGENIVLRKHIQGDLLQVLQSQIWDAAICFPPCTFLCRASAAHINNPGRRQQALQAIEFIKKIFMSPVPLVCVENPIGFLNTNWCKPTQIIYPWQFGDNYGKDICLWLRGFQKLVPSFNTRPVGRLRSVSNHKNGRMSQDQVAAIRSSWRYFPRLVEAMADQWSPVLAQAATPFFQSLNSPLFYEQRTQRDCPPAE